MSDCLINVRVLSWHFKLTKSCRVCVSRNDWHKAKGWPDGYFSIYDFFGVVK